MIHSGLAGCAFTFACKYSRRGLSLPASLLTPALLFWEILYVHLLASGVVTTPLKLHVPDKVDFSP